MSRLEVLPFDPSHLPGAGLLLAARHRSHRRDEPLLPARFEDPAVCAQAVAEVLAGEAASGAVAVRDGRVVGYLVGAPKPGDAWGPNVWVESAGHAVEQAEDVRDLYAAAATRWVDEGRTAHYALVPAHDEALVGAWFRLAFGHQHTHALCRPRPATTPSVLVRRAVRADVPALARLEVSLPEHQRRSPTFSSAALGSYEESLAEWTDDFDDPDFTTVVAEHDGQVVGSAVGCLLERSGSHTGPARPDGAGFVGFAAVLPEHRGHGAGRALVEALLAWSQDEGHPCVVTDWRATNLLSSRAWPAVGFRPTYLRLHRLVGH